MTKDGGKWANRITSIAAHVSKESSRLFILCSIVQLLSVSMLLAYLSYREAENRAGVLARGSASSLGLSMSAGDLFQIKNLLKSFATHETVSVYLFDEFGKVLSSASQGKTDAPNFEKRFQIKDWQILLWVRHPVVFNNIHYGDIAFLNTIQVRGWLIISLLLLSTNTIFFLWQNFSLKKLSLRIGTAVIEVVKIFDFALKNDHDKSQRQRTDFYEIEQLADNVFDAMNRIQITNSLEKEAAIGRITAHLSHDMRAPLSSIEHLMIASDDEISNMKCAVKDSLNRLYSMIEALRHTESESLVHRRKSKLNFEFGKESLKHKASTKGLILEITKENFDLLSIDAMKVERAWINLASNALDAAMTCVKVEATTSSDSLFIRVIDDGPGVPEKFLPRLFQRGATHGKAGGTGLGLAYVRQIMHGHGGDVTYRRDKSLTIFECRIPNAVVTEGENYLKNQAAGSPSDEAQVKKIVAVRFKPESLNRSLLAGLSSQKSENFEFSGEYEGSDVVATNDPELAVSAIEDGKEPLEFSSRLQETAIIDRMKRRFHLV